MRFASLIVASLIPTAEAAGTLLVAVSYETPNGWSRESFVNVTFLTGWEANQPGRMYAEWSGPGNPSISEIEGAPFYGNQPFNERLIGMVFNRGGTVIANQVEGDERRWRIRAWDRGRWIDPKLPFAR